MKKISLGLFNVIPAKAGIQRFNEITNILDPGFHRGDEYSVIFSHLRRNTTISLLFRGRVGVGVGLISCLFNFGPINNLDRRGVTANRSDLELPGDW